MNGGNRTGRYLKNNQATLGKKQCPSASYPSGHGGTDRYTTTPKPGSIPTANRVGLLLESQDSNWTLKELSHNALNDSKGRHDNGSHSPDSVFTASSGSNLSYHGGFQSGENYGSLQASQNKYAQSMLDIRKLFFEVSKPVEDSTSTHHRSNSLRRSQRGSASGDVSKGEFIKVKVGDFRDGTGTEELTRNKYKSESNLFELEIDETPLRWKERRGTVPLNAPVIIPSNVPIRTVTLKKSKGMFGFILNCKPICNDPRIPDSLRLYPHIESIVENSVAKASGLRCGDFVLEIGGKSVERGSFDRCNFLIRSSGDYMKLKVASYGQFRRTSVSRTVENTVSITGTRQNTFSPRTPVGHRSTRDFRYNDAKRKHVTNPTQLQRATSTPNLAAEDENPYEELNEAFSEQDPPHLAHHPGFPSQGQPEVNRSTSNASKNRNDVAKHSGNSHRDTQLNSMGHSLDGRGTHHQFPPLPPPPRTQVDTQQEGSWGRSARARKYSMGSLEIEITEERHLAHNRSEANGIMSAKDKRTQIDPTSSSSSVVPKMLSYSSSLENREEESERTRNPRQWNNKNRQEAKATDVRSGNKNNSHRTTDTRIGTASGAPVSTQLPTDSGRPRFPSTPQGDASGSSPIKNITPINTPRAGAIRGLSSNTATGLSSVSSGKVPAEPSMLPLPETPSYVAPHQELTNQRARMMSSDEQDEDPSHLLAAIRSHPLLRNRHLDYLEQVGSSRVPQVALFKDRAPDPLPKRKPGPPVRSTSTDELDANRSQQPRGRPQVRRSSETPSAAILPQTTIKNLRQIKDANKKTGNEASAAKIWNKNDQNINEKALQKSPISTNQARTDRSGTAHSTTKPTNHQQDIRYQHIPEVPYKNSMKKGLKLWGVTTEHSYSEETEEDRVETTDPNRGQSSPGNTCFTFDNVTGRLVLTGVTVDESEIDTVSLPPPPSEFTSGTPPDLVGSSRSTGITDSRRNPSVVLHATKVQPSMSSFYGNGDVPGFLRKKSADDDSISVDVTSLPPPVHFDDIPEEKEELRSRFKCDDTSFSKVRKPKCGLNSSDAVAVEMRKRFQSVQEPPIVSMPPPLEFQGSSEFSRSSHEQPTEPSSSRNSKDIKNSEMKTSDSFVASIQAKNLKPVLDLTNRMKKNPMFPDSSKTNETSTASKPYGGHNMVTSNRPPPPPNKPISAWSCSDVGDWLRSIGLECHVRVFISRSIDGKRLCDLTRNDLIDLGVKEVEHRRDIERAVLRMKAPKIT